MFPKYPFLFLILFLLTFELIAQDSLLFDRSSFKETSIAIGYNYSVLESQDKNYHLLELRFWKSQYGGGHYAIGSWYLSSEFGLNTDYFLMGLKAGVFVGYGAFILGTEMTYYTNFDQGTLRLVPFFGIGGHIFTLTFNPQIRLINKNFQPINQGQLNLTIRLFKLKLKEQ